jgi:hypothetical protein
VQENVSFSKYSCFEVQHALPLEGRHFLTDLLLHITLFIYVVIYIQSCLELHEISLFSEKMIARSQVMSAPTW